MSIVSPERPAVQSAAPSPSALLPHQSPSVYPFDCPSWCRLTHDLDAAVVLGTLTHMSAEFSVPNPAPLDGGKETLLRAQLFQMDRPESSGATRLYLGGETDVELDSAETEMLLVQIRAFLNMVEILGRQMG
ncbi:DUF6907 domain-containing protein [Streptomyces sp. NPDC088258]|uniref:DUF6907 domain-containing protein n=1 Tax=Streptomyces sp. NPDC088258 TaxID=3365849 RepID=UPI003807BC5C